MNSLPPGAWACLAPEEFSAETEKEAKEPGRTLLFRQGRLFVFAAPFAPLAWAAVHWKQLELHSFSSISEGARKLKALGKKWFHLSTASHRRGTLILEQLREWKRKESPFPASLLELSEEVKAFTLLSDGQLLVGYSFDRPDPEGVILFQEDKSAPSRAYLKLWEALALGSALPQPGESCLDLGACPGGWTWVAARVGAQVLAVDRAPLAPSVLALPQVRFQKGDAFQMLPDRMGPVDWLLSDVICYPEKLLELVEAWSSSGKARNMVCTIKFQGEADPKILPLFRRWGEVLHLYHNKHELTFMRRSEDQARRN